MLAAEHTTLRFFDANERWLAGVLAYEAPVWRWGALTGLLWGDPRCRSQMLSSPIVATPKNGRTLR